MRPPAVWSAAYRPLKPRALLVQLAGLIAVEVVLWSSYAAQEARLHWATHFLVGLTAAALLNLAWLTLKGAPARGLILWVIGLHLFAMAPDLVFPAGVPHAGWMDVFLGHISSHYLPGGDIAWLVIALGTSGLFAIALAGWLAARRGEVILGRQAP